MKINPKSAGACSLLLVWALSVSCAGLHSAKNLDPENREFLSVVRYLITKQERKQFLRLAPDQRPAFREDFWKKRDPDPYTEVNEYKEDYFARIEEANQLFRGPGPGWLSDRGRIYILLGPPGERYTYPTGYQIGDLPYEVWLYGFYPIFFVDRDWSGNYEMVPGSAYNLAQIQKTQMDWKPKIDKDEVVFDFELSFFEGKNSSKILVLKIPYANIWLTENEKKLETILSLSLIATTGKNNKTVWEGNRDYTISLTEAELEQMQDKKYEIRYPISLAAGEYELKIELENTTDENRISKTIKFKVET